MGGHEEISMRALVLVFSNPPLTFKNYTHNDQCGVNMVTQKPSKCETDSFNLTLPVNWLQSNGHTQIGNLLQHTWKT
jgi:hypothetical protein